MKRKRQVNMHWLLKAALCLMFLAFWNAKCDAQGLGTPPLIAVQPLGISVLNGGTAAISTTAVSTTPMEFHWYFNGEKMNNPPVANLVIPLVGTVSTLNITNASAATAGQYYVKIENGVGEVKSSSATLIVVANIVPVTLNIVTSTLGMTANGFNLQLSGPSGSNYVIEASTDLNSWTPISTNAAPGGSVTYTDTAATNLLSRFYRARLQ
jgi:hypothetical protein